jgi:hypothetical protein
MSQNEECIARAFKRLTSREAHVQVTTLNTQAPLQDEAINPDSAVNNHDIEEGREKR